ncbi:MAG: hypothetical protein NC117_03800 [Pseudoflavonifractor sp.]|nr:hypothetical protein [Pseudoflavonifractor sp.]
MTRYIPFLCVSLLLGSCSDSGQRGKGDVLVRVGESCLTESDLRSVMPYNLNGEDSVRFVSAYVRGWIDSKLVSEIAAKNIGDLSSIDRLVAEYRDELVMMEYRKRMAMQNADTDFAIDTLRHYYDSHRNDFILEQPLVKGIYIKIEENAPQLDDIKKWYRSDDAEDIERLEKYGLKSAIHYDYFRDRWVGWEQIDAKMPVAFGRDINRVLESRKEIEVAGDGSVYLLSVSDWIPAGEQMPFEYASDKIREILINRRRLEYDTELRRSLYEEGLKSGKVEVNMDLGVSPAMTDKNKTS